MRAFARLRKADDIALVTGQFDHIAIGLISRQSGPFALQREVMCDTPRGEDQQRRSGEDEGGHTNVRRVAGRSGAMSDPLAPTGDSDAVFMLLAFLRERRAKLAGLEPPTGKKQRCRANAVQQDMLRTWRSPQCRPYPLGDDCAAR